ncbi:hypothetical protein Vadar_008747 [Vaccinium darrowii]|uniref:Uncharacterized protein n=1 Tax=Vaccinium darrowii TaxID=229202 RepID=A0ACB7WZB6_9ERIC|nr:hypothetical protein Vadar_008747 [Vaccinium darrowii]
MLSIDSAQHMESRRLNGKMVAVVVTSSVLTSVLIITLVFWWVMKKQRRGQEIKDSEEENVELPIFDMVTIAGATNNFSDTNKIGEGGFGSVYKNGNLIIYDSTPNSTVWETNVSVVSHSAQLLDSGNLVLFQGDSGTSGVFWQSFDHPTNTMLPNMKLGLDRKTGLEQFLTTWKSGDDPGTGEYSYRVEPSEMPQLVLFKGSTRVWRMAAWLARHQSAKPEATPTFIFNGTYVNNRDEVSTFYTLINASNVSKLFLDELGTLKMVTWVGKWVEFYSYPNDQCDYYSRCGMMVIATPTMGESFTARAFRGTSPGPQMSGTCGIHQAGASGSARHFPCVETEKEGGERANCLTWYENLTDVRKFERRFPNGGLDLYVRVDAVELAQHRESRRLNGKMVAVVVISAVLTSVLIIAIFFWLVMKKRRRGEQ